MYYPYNTFCPGTDEGEGPSHAELSEEEPKPDVMANAFVTVRKKKNKPNLKKSDHTVSDDSGAGTSKANSSEGEGSDEEVISQTLSMKKLQNVRTLAIAM